MRFIKPNIEGYRFVKLISTLLKMESFQVEIVDKYRFHGHTIETKVGKYSRGANAKPAFDYEVEVICKDLDLSIHEWKTITSIMEVVNEVNDLQSQMESKINQI